MYNRKTFFFIITIIKINIFKSTIICLSWGILLSKLLLIFNLEFRKSENTLKCNLIIYTYHIYG